MFKKHISSTLLSKVMSRVSVSITGTCLVLSGSIGAVANAADTSFVIVSAKDNYWKNGAVAEGSGTATVTVNANEKKQNWSGLAGTFNEAGWDVLTLLDQGERDRAMRLLFDKKDGIGLQWGRVPIGASDYAKDRYSLDDGTGDDLTMERFSIARDKECLIKYIKAAQAVNKDIKFWASPWTPPPWMKKNTISGGGGYDGGTMRNETNVLKAHALYFSKFVTSYGAEGIKINAVCPQNEPGYTRDYPTCGWGKYNDQAGTDHDDPEYLSTFVADHLYPKLQADNPGTQIWFGTLSNATTAPGYWNGMKTKAGANAKTMIKGLGLQWSNVSLVTANANDYFTFCSEHKCGNYYWLTAKATGVADANRDNFLASMAPNNHAYGEESWDLIKEWVTAGAHLYSAWNMVLDTKGMNLNRTQQWPQNALLAVDRTTKQLQVTAYYYVMRHIGQYVDSGAVRLGTSGGDALAFQNPNGSIVTIISNTGAQKDMIVSVGGKSYKFSHPGKGWATLFVGPAPVKAVSDLASTRSSFSESGLAIVNMGSSYSVTLPSRNAGRIELLDLSGRVLESKLIPQGSSSVMLGHQASNAGLLLVKVVYGNEVKTARLVTY